MGQLPIAAAEMAMRAEVMSESEVMKLAESFFLPATGAQVFVKTPAEGQWTPNRDVLPGIYLAQMERSREGLALSELVAEDEVLVNGLNPRRGRPVEGSTRIFRVCSLQRAVDPRTGRLEPWVVEAAGRLEAAADLRRC
jgi:hypothetical protein